MMNGIFRSNKRRALYLPMTIMLLLSLLLSSGITFAQDEVTPETPVEEPAPPIEEPVEEPAPPPDSGDKPDEEPIPEPADDIPLAPEPDEKSIETAAIKDWTFMVYLAADNNLEAAAVTDFLEMAQVGSTAKVNIVVQMDRAPGYDTRYGDWTDTRRFYITKSLKPYPGNAKMALGEINMGSQYTLKNFVVWAKTKYPARKYALILWNHGGGFQPTSDDISSAGVAWDDSSSNDYISNNELSWALGQVTNGGSNKLELVGFDACLMAQMEVHQHVKNYAKYSVGSEASEPNNGWPYNTILAALKANPGWSGQTLANTVVAKYYASYGNHQTQSAVRYGTPYATLVTRLNAFSNALITKINASPSFRTTIKNAFTATRYFHPDYDYGDLSDFALQIKNRTPSTSAQHIAAKNLIAAIANVVTNNKAGPEFSRAKGITIFMPRTQERWGYWAASYQANQLLPKQTQWNEFLNKYYNTDMTITLTWGGTVSDLDSHLWLPAATPYHVKWTDRGTLTAFPFAYLDNDDTYYYGPENISISQFKPGVYQYAVYKWTGTTTPYLKDSGAVIKVYLDGVLKKTLNVSTAGGDSTGRWWRAFTYNATSKTFTWTNTLASTPGSAYDPNTSAVGVTSK